jgi:hypothetical protein
MKSTVSLLISLLMAAFVPRASGKPADLTTLAERTELRQTGRYDEVVTLCGRLHAVYPRQVRCLRLGRTPEGREMVAVAASADGVLSAAAARRRGRPVVLVVGGIHAGEIEGKDAGFMLLRDLLAEPKGAAALRAATLVFVPVFNVDGHERFGPNHRPNQRGPEQMGMRVTAQGLNLNRDWVKAEAPEMQLMLGLTVAWDPLLLVDLHTTDGAKFEHDVGLIVAPRAPGGGGLGEAGRGLTDRLMTALAARGHLPVPFYPDFRNEDEPSSGIEDFPMPPRFSQAYFAARNRLGVLVETHSWRPYAHRVKTTRAVLEVLLAELAANGAAWRRAADDADRAWQQGTQGVTAALAWRAGPQPRMIDFRGYAYSRTRSEISGAMWIQYDEGRPQIWKMPLYDHPEPVVTAAVPGGGYLVPTASADWVARKLALHGIAFQRVPAAAPAAATAAPEQGAHAVYRIERAAFGAKPSEGRLPVKVSGRWQAEPAAAEPGALFVPVRQPRGLLVMHLFEPEAPDSLMAWGYFNQVLEPKQSIADYVIELEARAMLARQPGLRAEFEQALKADPAMAADPRRRLRFFSRLHPSWDRDLDKYPVLRVERAPKLGILGR